MNNEEKPVLNTGRLRALAREAERARFVADYYANTTFKGDTRASRRRLEKAMKKHEEAMALRARRRKA